MDVRAIVSFAGIAVVEDRRHSECRAWLTSNNYLIDSVDCTNGLAEAIPALGDLCRWEEKFGYVLKPDDRNLNALRDGFCFLEAPDGDGGRVLEVIRPELAWEEDSEWLLGLLSIAKEHSREQLALGRRFFTLLAIEDSESALINQIFDISRVPGPISSL
jgi:hypothetical protein